MLFTIYFSLETDFCDISEKKLTGGLEENIPDTSVFQHPVTETGR